MIRNGKITPVGFISIMVVLIVVFIIRMNGNYNEKKENKENFNNNPKVEGTIEDVDIIIKGGGKDSRTYRTARISYFVDGKEYNMSFYYPSVSRDMVGQSIPVAYEVDNPNNAYIDVYGSSLFDMETGFLALGLVGVIAVFFIYIYRRLQNSGV